MRVKAVGVHFRGLRVRTTGLVSFSLAIEQKRFDVVGAGSSIGTSRGNRGTGLDRSPECGRMHAGRFGGVQRADREVLRRCVGLDFQSRELGDRLLLIAEIRELQRVYATKYLLDRLSR